MRRFHVSCAACGHPRMRVVAKFWKTVRRPQAVEQNLYQCPKCGENWSRNPQGITNRIILGKVPPNSGWRSRSPDPRGFPQ